MNKLFHVVTNNINIKDQWNDAIAYDPRFDNEFSLSRVSIMDPLEVVIVTLRGGEKNRKNIIYGLTWTWDSGATDIMIKSKHTIPYEHRILSNKVEYSTEAGPYCTTHDDKVPFVCHIF